MPITVKCECGKTLKVDDKHRGKKAKCPACGNVLLVEESDADTGVQAEAPKKSRASDDDKGAVKSGAPKKRADADDDDDGGDSGTRKKPKRPAKSNMMMYMIGGGCVLLLTAFCCVGGGGTGLFWYLGWWPFGGVDADLIYVHDGVAGFVSVRPADFWKNPTVKAEMAKADNKKDMDKEMAEVESKIGLKMEDWERGTLIVRSADFNMMGGKEPDMAFVVKTSRAMDPKKIVAFAAEKSGEKEKEVTHEGIKYYVIAGKRGRDGMVLHFPSDRVLLGTMTEAGLKDVLKKSKIPAKNAALVRGVQMASSGRYVVVAAAELKKDVMEKLPKEALQAVPNFKDVNGAILTMTLAKDLTIESVLTFPSRDIAGKAKPDIEKGVTTLQGLMKMGGGGGMPAGYAKFMDSLKVEQRGAEVAIIGKVDLNVKDLGVPLGGFGMEQPGMKDEVAMVGGGGAPVPIGPGALGAAPRQMHVNHMKQVGLAMHAFHDANKTLPNHPILHPQTGQPLLSWRVAILPYIEEGALFNQIKLNEPWDSPHNKQFANKMPRIYQVPGRPNDGKTHLQVFHGDQAAFSKSKKTPGTTLAGDVHLTDFSDGCSNTIMVVEAATPVNWMAPDDIPFQIEDSSVINRVGNYWGNNTFQALMADGRVLRLQRSVNAPTMKALITRNGGESFSMPE